MGAHVLTALREVQSWPDEQLTLDGFRWGQLQAALNLSCWTELLEGQDYDKLQSLVTSRDCKGLQKFVADIIPLYIEKWEAYNRPRTREEWVYNWYKLVTE